MSKRKTRKYATIMIIFFVIAGLLGVFTANYLSGLFFGQGIVIESMDKVVDGKVNFLVLGVDDGGLRSDTMMLASLDSKTGKVTVISIPRDTRVLMGSYHAKINSAIGVGEQEVKRGRLEEPEEYPIAMVKSLLDDIPINYFATVDFDGFIEIMDILGGVDYDVPIDMHYEDPEQDLYIHLNKGFQHLDGKACHDFVRFRMGYPTGDIGRVEAQQNFIKEVIKQKVTPLNIAKSGAIFSAASKYVRTNFTALDLASMLPVLGKIDTENVETIQLPGEAYYVGGVSYFICDEIAATELAREIMSTDATVQ